MPARTLKLKGHRNEVKCVQVTPDGQHVVSGSADKTVRISSLSDGKLVRELKAPRGEFPFSDPVPHAVACTGQHVVSGFSDKTVRI